MDASDSQRGAALLFAVMELEMLRLDGVPALDGDQWRARREVLERWLVWAVRNADTESVAGITARATEADLHVALHARRQRNARRRDELARLCLADTASLTDAKWAQKKALLGQWLREALSDDDVDSTADVKAIMDEAGRLRNALNAARRGSLRL